MKLKINNIGPFSGEHEIRIDGITILAGKNGTGKSTFGKVLYCFFSTFYNINEQVENDKKRSIRRILWNYIRNNERIIGIRKNISTINNFAELFFSDEENELTRDDVYETLTTIFDGDEFKEDREELSYRIIEVLQLNNKKIMENLLQNRITTEFGNQIGNLNSKDDVSAELMVKGQKISIQATKGRATIENHISLAKNIIYIDDPNIIDEIDVTLLRDYDKSHRTELLEKLKTGGKQQVSSADQILIQNRIQTIEDKLNTVCDGNIQMTDTQGYRYRSKEYQDGLDIGNMATGLKSFALLKKILKDGYLEENGIIIFDEPEIHLHPEWQRIWAEIIVLLNKVLGINILLSTHSSDFLGFLELFIQKHEVKDNTSLYLLNKQPGNGSINKDISNEWNLAYEQLGEPFIQATEELDAINASK